MDSSFDDIVCADDCEYYNRQAELQNSFSPTNSSPEKNDTDLAPRQIKVLRVSHPAARQYSTANSVSPVNGEDDHFHIPLLDEEHMEYFLLEWARSVVNNQSLSLQMNSPRRRLSPTETIMEISSPDNVAHPAAIDDEEPDFELLMLQRLRQTMDRSFLQKMSSCCVLIDHSTDNMTWFSFLLDACDGAEYLPLIRNMGCELLGMPSPGDDGQVDGHSDGDGSRNYQREEDQIRVACVDGQWVTSDTEALNSICVQLCSGSAAGSGLLNDSGRPNHHNLVLEHLVDNLRQRRVDGRPAVIILTNFQQFAVEEASHKANITCSWAKRKQLLVYTLLDLMHKKDLHFLLIGVTATVDLQLLLEKRVISRMNAQFIHLPGIPSEEAVMTFMAKSCQLPSQVPESLRVGQWKEFVQKFNRKAEKTFRAGSRSLLRRVVRAHLQWGCNMTFFRRVLGNALGSLTPLERFLEKKTIVEAFKLMEPPTLREILMGLTQLELLVYSCAARLGIAAKRDSDIPGLFILQDILTELPKLGSWAAADLTGYSFASSGKQRSLSQFYVLDAVRSLLSLGLLSSEEGKASTSTRGLRPVPLNAAVHGAAVATADDDDAASAVNTIRFAAGRWQGTDSSLSWPSTLIQGPHTLLFLRHSPLQIRQAFSLKSTIDPISGQVDRQYPLRMTDRLRKAVLLPLEPIIVTGSTMGLRSGLGLGLGPDNAALSDIDGHALNSSSWNMPSSLRVATALEDRAL